MLSTRTYVVAYLTSCKQHVPPNRLTFLSSLNRGRPCLPGHAVVPGQHLTAQAHSQHCAPDAYQFTAHLAANVAGKHPLPFWFHIRPVLWLCEQCEWESHSNIYSFSPLRPATETAGGVSGAMWHPCATPQPPLLQHSTGWCKLPALGTRPSCQESSGTGWLPSAGQQPSLCLKSAQPEACAFAVFNFVGRAELST